ncbi:MAG: mechanosensitive ion channel family protein [Methanomassiliicoccales archaeon]|nr:mechanosensitive ion channel family protein [Methanomassiliicoccales archaeon]
MSTGSKTTGWWSVISVAIITFIAALLYIEVDRGIVPFLDLTSLGPDVAKILLATTIICTAWLVIRFIGAFFENLIAPIVGSYAPVRSAWKIISYAIWAFILLALLLSMIGDIGSLGVYIGLMGAALTFVLQKPLLNIVGWVLITYRRLYRIGDRIMVGNVKGYVLDIHIMYTEVREFGEWMKGDTFTGRIAVIPNSIVFDGAILNYTKDLPIIWDEVATMVTYESDIDLAKRYIMESATEVIGKEMAGNYDLYRSRLGIRDLDQLLLRAPELRMEMVDSGVNIFVLYFCGTEKRRVIKSEITERIWRRFMADPKVDIAYPHVHLVGMKDQ